MSNLAKLVETYRRRHWRIVTAESCTGGMIAASLTEIAGSSEIFDRGFVTYSNAAKTELLNVPESVIDRHGAVSAEVAQAMAKGALARANADVALSVTGIAGPGGGSPDKPVGLVFLACISKTRPPVVEQRNFAGNRVRIREQARECALDMLMTAAS